MPATFHYEKEKADSMLSIFGSKPDKVKSELLEVVSWIDQLKDAFLMG